MIVNTHKERVRLYAMAALHFAAIGALLVVLAIFTPIPAMLLVALGVLLLGVSTQLLADDESSRRQALGLGALIWFLWVTPRLFAMIALLGDPDGAKNPWDKPLGIIAANLPYLSWLLTAIVVTLALGFHFVSLRTYLAKQEKWGAL